MPRELIINAEYHSCSCKYFCLEETHEKYSCISCEMCRFQEKEASKIGAEMIQVEEIENIFDLNRQVGMWQSQNTINGPWVGHQRTITDQDIKDHLRGITWIATKPRGVTLANLGSGATTRWLIIDIDDHGDRSDRYGPVESRLQTIFRILKTATPMVFSSPRGQGKHVYYRCAKEIPINKLVVPIINLCLAKDIFLAKDGTELHPLPSAFFRYPLGRMQKLERIGSFVYKKPPEGVEAFLEVRSKLNELAPIQAELLTT